MTYKEKETDEKAILAVVLSVFWVRISKVMLMVGMATSLAGLAAMVQRPEIRPLWPLFGFFLVYALVGIFFNAMIIQATVKPADK